MDRFISKIPFFLAKYFYTLDMKMRFLKNNFNLLSQLSLYAIERKNISAPLLMERVISNVFSLSVLDW